MVQTHSLVPEASSDSMPNTALTICTYDQEARMGQVRMLPDVAAQALDLAKDPDVSIGPFVRD